MTVRSAPVGYRCFARRLPMWGVLVACTAPTDSASNRHSGAESAFDTTAVADTSEATEDAGEAPVPPEVRTGFSHEHGLYEALFELSLDGAETVDEIRYTLDGTDPALAGTLYEGEIQIPTTTFVRAVWLVGGEVVEDATRTYVFAADVMAQQAPSTWPTEWWLEHDGGPYAADYEMDPDVFATAEEAAAFPAVFEAIPVVSLTLDPEDLFGHFGIHENPLDEGEDWERPGNIELFGLGDGGVGPSVRCGVRIQGGASRRADRTPKKSFRVAFRTEYGEGSLNYPLYEGSDVAEFQTFVLRAGYNRTWPNWQDGQRTRSQYVRERFGLESHRALGALSPQARPVHLFLDGLYWGLYLMEERPDGDFFESHLGSPEEEWDVLNSGEAVDGDRVAWDAMMAAVRAADGELATVAEHLDIEAFADYMLLNLYYGNTDWPIKNWYGARHRSSEGRWRFVIWDFEMSVGDLVEDVLDVQDEDTPGEMFATLRSNLEFVTLFGDRIQRHVLEADGALHGAAGGARWQALAADVVPAVIAESARWGDHWRDVRGEDTELYTYADQWLTEYARVTEDYMPGRSAEFVAHAQAVALYPTLAVPIVTVASGEVPTGSEVSLTSDAVVYVTTDGSDPRAAGGAVAATAVEAGLVLVTEATTLHARSWQDGVWSALVERTYTVY